MKWPVRSLSLSLLILTLVSFASSTQAQFRDVTIGGWGGVTFSDDERQGSKPGFDIYAWYLYVMAHPKEGYTFFGEVEFEHGPEISSDTSSGKLILERLYLERNFSNPHNVRVGKFFLPFGYWYLSHWSFLTETFTYPYSFENHWVPRFQVGIQYYGKVHLGETSFNYYSWVGNGPDINGTNSRSVSEPGWGGSLFIERRKNSDYKKSIGVVAGIHGQTERIDTGQNENQFNAVFGLKGRYERIELRTEWYQHYRQYHQDYTSGYFNGLAWIINDKFGLNLRQDFGDNLELTQSSHLASHEAFSSSFGFLWRPEAVVVIKGEYRINKFDGGSIPAYDQWNIFFGMKF